MLTRNPGTPAGKHRSRSKSNQDSDRIILYCLSFSFFNLEKFLDVFLWGN